MQNASSYNNNNFYSGRKDSMKNYKNPQFVRLKSFLISILLLLAMEAVCGRNLFRRHEGLIMERRFLWNNVQTLTA